MSYTIPSGCRDRFTAEQARQMQTLGAVGIEPLEVNGYTGYCSGQAPCASPCSAEEIQEVKTDFYRRCLQWKEALEELPFISDEEEREQTRDTIHRLQLSMNRKASLILQHYALDTVEIKTDSILRWLELAETFSADYHRARPAEARLYNMQGALVKRWRLGGGASPCTLDLSQQGLPSGIYLVEVRTAQGQVFRQKAILSS